MAKSPPTYVQVDKIKEDQYFVAVILNKTQLDYLYELAEPKSRSWRGVYQSMTKGFVRAYRNLQINNGK